MRLTPHNRLIILTLACALPVAILAQTERGDAQSAARSFPGLLRAHEVKVSARVPGMLSEVKVAFGDEVEAKATLGVVNKDLQSSRVELMDARVKQREAELAAAEAERDAAVSNKKREERSRTSSDADKEVAATAALRAEALYQAATAIHEGAEAELRGAQALLDQHDIVTPVSGTVTEVFRRPGESVAGTASDVIFVVAERDVLWVEVLVPIEIQGIKKDSPAWVLPMGNAKEIPAKVTGVIEALGVTGEYRVRVEFSTEDRSVRSGLDCTVRF